MSRFKHQMGMAKVTYVAMLRGLGINIHRVAVYRILIRQLLPQIIGAD